MPERLAYLGSAIFLEIIETAMLVANCEIRSQISEDHKSKLPEKI